MPCKVKVFPFLFQFKDRNTVLEKGLMHGFDWVVWAVVFIQAIGGLIVAVVMKYADNILKGFATSISIIVGTIAAIYFFDNWPQLLFIGGAILVIGAVVMYSVFPYKKKVLPPEVELEEKTVEQKQ